MRIRCSSFLTTIGIMAAAHSSVATAAEEEAGLDTKRALEEIVVSARRRDESLQDVPQTINVVTASQIEKLDIRNFTDVQSLVPGLTLTGGGSFSTAATVRGVSFAPEASGNNPTVEFYLNDTPISSNFLFQSMFDVGQLEVLRGPQGTLRGRAAPSGSITVTTRRPDLAEYGASANVTMTDRHSYKYDGAVNIPILRDKLALRVAAVSDENQFNRVESVKRSADPVHNKEPFRDSEALRASVRFEPTDWFDLNLMYQTLNQENISYAQMQSASLVTGAAPSDPLIRPYDFLSLDDQGTYARQEMDVYIWNANFHFAGQRLSYSGANNVQDFGSIAPNDAGDYFAPARFAVTERAFQDPSGYQAVCMEQAGMVDLIPTNQNFFQCTHGRAIRKSHELRLASEERLFGMFDYVLGAFYDRNDNPTRVTQETALLANPTRIARVNTTAIERDGDSTEKSTFANVTAHLTSALEVSGGVRFIDYENFSSLKVNGAFPTPATDSDDSTSIYNASIKYRFTDNLMLYGTVGTSWRPGVRVVGNFSANITERELSFMNLPAEESTSYELGLKTSFLDGRGRFNLSAYQQDFNDYVYRGVPVYYVNYRRVSPTVVVPEVATFSFVAGVPVQVEGVEAEATYQILSRWYVSGNVSYADGQIDNGRIACTDLNGDGSPDVNVARPTLAQLQAAVGAGQNVSTCQFSGRSSFVPKWSANLQSEASFGITPRLDGFVRGLAAYTPSNSQDPNNTFDTVDSYTLLNLFAGVRASNGLWEVSLFARNVFDETVVLNTGGAPLSTGLTTLTFGPGGAVTGSTASSFSSGYHSVSVVPEREVGVTLRFGFGSR
jgi:iron complex outermembrane receptor protein